MMSFGDSIKTVFKKYATFTGTATRAEYWWFTLLYILISLPVQIFAEVVEATDSDNIGVALIFLPIALLYLAWVLGTLVPTLAVTVRRLRDGGFHWAFIFLSLIPFLGSIALIVLLAMPSKAQPAAPAPQAPTPPAAS